jgi:L-threonylcarbamoyladenylate synthase
LKTGRNSIPEPTELLTAETPSLFDAAVRRAAEVLRQGRLVGLPTETVYGLAANAFDPGAVANIFQTKGRPSNNPLIVHVADAAMAQSCVRVWPSLAERLAEAFWPGPLTLVLPRADKVPDIVTAGGGTVAIRWPAHPLMLAVIKACGFPLAAPSANLSNRASPTTAQHVLQQLGGRIPLVIDGGPCHVGIESTVLDVTCNPPLLLRPGMIHEAALVAVTGALATGHGGSGGVLRSPGMLEKHYSPNARLLVRSWKDEAGLGELLRAAGAAPGTTGIIAHTQIPRDAGYARVAVVPRDAQAFARALYAELHQCDAAGVELIVIEQLPEGPEWQGVQDRLQRAAAV